MFWRVVPGLTRPSQNGIDGGGLGFDQSYRHIFFVWVVGRVEGVSSLLGLGRNAYSAAMLAANRFRKKREHVHCFREFDLDAKDLDVIRCAMFAGQWTVSEGTGWCAARR